jgi:hypothetical protein
LPEEAFARVTMEPPREASHGDMATNAALVVGKLAKVAPPKLAADLARALAELPEVEEAAPAGPGFVNLRLREDYLRGQLPIILREGEEFGQGAEKPGTVNVEYVSANPTGPMHVGHCRGAVVGDALAALLAKAGHQVTREYYINDAGAQVQALAWAAYWRYLEALPVEAHGLWALMTFIRARRNAQTDAAGAFVPLALQEVTRWDRDAIVRADQALWIAAQRRQPGPFQLEAAVQSAHCHRLFAGVTPWRAIAAMYVHLNALYPTHGSLVAGAVAAAEAGDVPAGLRQLEAMDAELRRSFQPWWVARAHLLGMSGPAHRPEAEAAYLIALGLTTQRRLKVHLESRLTKLRAP